MRVSLQNGLPKFFSHNFIPFPKKIFIIFCENILVSHFVRKYASVILPAFTNPLNYMFHVEISDGNKNLVFQYDIAWQVCPTIILQIGQMTVP